MSKVYIVGFKKGKEIGKASKPKKELKKLLKDLGIKVKREFKTMDYMFTVEDLTDEQIQTLLSNDLVRYVEEPVKMQAKGYPSETEEDADYGKDLINADAMWDMGYLGTGMKVAVLDTGIDDTHIEFQNSDGTNAVKKHAIFTGESFNYQSHSHGTHCAGTVGARGGNGGIAGVAPECDLYNGKVLDESGSTVGDSSIQGIDWAISEGVDVISMSLGGLYFGMSNNDAMLRAYEAGIIVACASGNEDTQYVDVNSPANGIHGLAVASVGSTKSVSSFSSRGYGNIVSAPGELIKSSIIGGGYESWNGTSMATPHVAGMMALIKQANLDSASVCTKTIDELYEIIIASTEDVNGSGKDIYTGYGLIKSPKNPQGTITRTEDSEILEESLDTLPSAIDSYYNTGVINTTKQTEGAGCLEITSSTTDWVGHNFIIQPEGNNGNRKIPKQLKMRMMTEGEGYIWLETSGVDIVTEYRYDTDGGVWQELTLDLPPTTGVVNITFLMRNYSSGGQLHGYLDDIRFVYDNFDIPELKNVIINNTVINSGDTITVSGEVTNGVSGISGQSVSVKLTNEEGSYPVSTIISTDANGDFLHSFASDNAWAGSCRVEVDLA